MNLVGNQEKLLKLEGVGPVNAINLFIGGVVQSQVASEKEKTPPHVLD